MVRYIVIFIGVVIVEGDNLKRDCLECHTLHSIPSEMIYRRYLMSYSSKDKIKKRIFEYLQNPNPKTSIMPPQFFLKFTMKRKSLLEESIMRERIDEFISHYDVEGRISISK
jgi:hypothetical protein